MTKKTNLRPLADSMNALDMLQEAVYSFQSGHNPRSISVQITEDPDVSGEPQNNVIYDALRKLEELSEREGVDIAIIGGAATIHHGYPRFTRDLDIVVSTDGFDKVIKTAYKYGFDIKDMNDRGFSTLTYQGFPIEVIEQGHFHHDPDDYRAMPDPKQLGVERGIDYASLAGWVRLKLISGRSQDIADVVNVLKGKTPQDLEEIEENLAAVNPDLATKLQSILSLYESEIR